MMMDDTWRWVGFVGLDKVEERGAHHLFRQEKHRQERERERERGKKERERERVDSCM